MCSSLSTLSMNAYDFILLQEDRSEPHGVMLPHLQSLDLRCNWYDRIHFSCTAVFSLDRSDTILSTSPIQELEMKSIESAVLICRILTFKRATLPSLRQLLFSASCNAILRHDTTEGAQLIAAQLAGHCTRRNLVRLVTHDDNSHGNDEEPCSCCS